MTTEAEAATARARTVEALNCFQLRALVHGCTLCKSIGRVLAVLFRTGNGNGFEPHGGDDEVEFCGSR